MDRTDSAAPDTHVSIQAGNPIPTGPTTRSAGRTVPGLGSLTKTIDTVHPRLAQIFVPWSLRNPRYLRSFIRLSRAFKKSEKTRKENIAAGLQVPPFLILSITGNCNLACLGCFAAAVGTIPKNGKAKEEPEQRIAAQRMDTTFSTCYGNPSHPVLTKRKQLDAEQWRSIITDAHDLGTFGFVMAGGEPFLFPDLLDLCADFKDRFFIILTNGTALTDANFKQMKHMGNIAVMVSLEGDAEQTDARRGTGVHRKALDTLDRLRKIGVLTGISVTITRENFRYWMNTDNLDRFVDDGIHLGALIEYIPLTPCEFDVRDYEINHGATRRNDLPSGITDSNDVTEKHNDHHLMLTPEERQQFRNVITDYRAHRPVYLIHSPGDEEFFGGCVSAGRGFAHVTPSGDLTPCPVSDIATHNLTTTALRTALSGPLFAEIRKNEHLLETEGMPCALFAHPQEVHELAQRVGAYRTG